MIELMPSEFRFGNYGADIPFTVFMDNKKLVDWLKQRTIIGYSFTPEFKQREDFVAILIEDEDGLNSYWSHIPVEVFEILNG